MLVFCSPAEEWPRNRLWRLPVLLLRSTGERLFFPTLTDTSVSGQPFARTPPLLHVVPSAIHQPRRAVRSHGGPFSLSVWPQQKWVRACRGRGHREKVNYALFPRTSMDQSDQQSVTGKIMHLSSHWQGRRVSLLISAVNLCEWEGKSRETCS